MGRGAAGGPLADFCVTHQGPSTHHLFDLSKIPLYDYNNVKGKSESQRFGYAVWVLVVCWLDPVEQKMAGKSFRAVLKIIVQLLSFIRVADSP